MPNSFFTDKKKRNDEIKKVRVRGNKKNLLKEIIFGIKYRKKRKYKNIKLVKIFFFLAKAP